MNWQQAENGFFNALGMPSGLRKTMVAQLYETKQALVLEK
jgi:hypothetical protein